MRIFIAIEPGEASQPLLQAELLRSSKLAPTARWVRPDSLHLSLAFLGEVPDGRVAEVGQAMARVAGRHAPHRLQARGSGTFGPLDAPKVLWVGVAGDLEKLASLQSDLARELIALEVPPDFERFVPHITLARSRAPRGDPALARMADRLGAAVLGDIPVREIVLFASETDEQGMRYRPIRSETIGKICLPSR